MSTVPQKAKLEFGVLLPTREAVMSDWRDPGSIHPSIYMTVAAGAKSDAEEGMAFLAQYYDRPYEAVANSMLGVTGTWDEVIDKIEAYREAGDCTVVLRFAARDQARRMESCAAALKRRCLLK